MNKGGNLAKNTAAQNEKNKVLVKCILAVDPNGGALQPVHERGEIYGSAWQAWLALKLRSLGQAQTVSECIKFRGELKAQKTFPRTKVFTTIDGEQYHFEVVEN
jgi:hypothetical protein